MKKNEATGKMEASFFDTFPAQTPVSAELIERGRGRFNIYCAPCHGMDGYGHGPVNDRALELMNLGQSVTWTQAASMHAEPARSRPVGHIYNTINLGIRNMPGYGHQVQAPADRWAIVAYVRALQLSQDPPASAVAADKPAAVESAPRTVVAEH
jgi:mono/diheme cytochrome c family protein